MRIKAVFFDMDGVIFDSERAVLVCWQEVGARFSLRGIEQVFVGSGKQSKENKNFVTAQS